LLVPFDVAIRRVQLDWGVIRGWFTGRRVSSGETMGALLRRKKEVKQTLSPQRADLAQTIQPPIPTGVNRRYNPFVSDKKAVAEKSAAPGDTAANAPMEPESTTGRLLARKRKRQSEEDR
jgi:hypothetical protein